MLQYTITPLLIFLIVSEQKRIVHWWPFLFWLNYSFRKRRERIWCLIFSCALQLQSHNETTGFVAYCVFSQNPNTSMCCTFYVELWSNKEMLSVRVKHTHSNTGITQVTFKDHCHQSRWPLSQRACSTECQTNHSQCWGWLEPFACLERGHMVMWQCVWCVSLRCCH